MRAVTDLRCSLRTRVEAHEDQRAQPPEPFTQEHDAGALDTAEQRAALMCIESGERTAEAQPSAQIQYANECCELPLNNGWPGPERTRNDAVHLQPVRC